MRAPRDLLFAATVAALVVGAALNLLFDQTLTRVLGVLALLAFVVLGAFLIASPDYLGRSDDPDS
jgi:hypothetical protein